MPDSETASSTTEASQYEPDRARVQRIVEKVDSNANGKIDVSEAKELLCMVLGIPENDVPDDHEDVIEFSGLSTAAMVDRLCEEAERGHVNAYYDAVFPAAADVGGGRAGAESDKSAPPSPSQTSSKCAASSADPSSTVENSGGAGGVADRELVVRIVQKLDTDSNGEISAGEARVLLARLLGISEGDLPEDHQGKDAACMPACLPACPPSEDHVLAYSTHSAGGVRILTLGLVSVAMADVVEFAGLTTAAMVDRLCEEVDGEKVDAYYKALFAKDPGEG